MNKDTILFKPRISNGGYLVFCVAGFFIFLGVEALMFSLGYKITFGAKIFSAILSLVFLGYGVVLIPFGIAFYKMHYIIGKEELNIECGWQKKKIIYNDIVDIVSKDIKLNKVASGAGFIKYKSFTLGKTQYLSEGIINMMSTSLDTDVTIITLKNGERYGITPNNKDKFIKVIGEKLAI